MNASQITPEVIRQAQFPHNLLISAIFLFNLLLAPAVIVMDVGLAGMVLPVILTSLVVAYLYRRSRQATQGFVDAHWRWAFRRGLWLLAGYTVSGAFLLIAELLSLSAHDPNMKHILLTALTRIALMPTLVAVMITLVMEASAYGQAGRGQVSEKLLPPAV